MQVTDNMRDYHCTYREAGPLRRNREATRYFRENFSLFMQFAVALLKYYERTENKRFMRPAERIRTLTSHIETEDILWVKLLEHKLEPDGATTIYTVSNIIAKMLVDQEKPFMGKELRTVDPIDCPDLDDLRKDIWNDFDL